VPVSIEIAGEGALLETLTQQAERLGIGDRVHFHGRVEPAQLPALLKSCNVYVSMPITEGVSASLFEAMACGCYPIVSDLPANRFWIAHGDNGSLVPVDDCVALESGLLDFWNRRDRCVDVLRRNRRLVEASASLHDNVRYFVERYQRLLTPGGVMATGQPARDYRNDPA
jgi:glycosyltransferase involved in cell wall biosynthesis